MGRGWVEGEGGAGGWWEVMRNEVGEESGRVDKERDGDGEVGWRRASEGCGVSACSSPPPTVQHSRLSPTSRHPCRLASPVFLGSPFDVGLRSLASGPFLCLRVPRRRPLFIRPLGRSRPPSPPLPPPHNSLHSLPLVDYPSKLVSSGSVPSSVACLFSLLLSL